MRLLSRQDLILALLGNVHAVRGRGCLTVVPIDHSEMFHICITAVISNGEGIHGPLLAVAVRQGSAASKSGRGGRR